jgi:hypothetical protein
MRDMVQVYPELWSSNLSDEAPLGTDAAEEHGSYPHIGLVPGHEIVGKRMKKHFSDYPWRKILESEGFRNSGLYHNELWNPNGIWTLRMCKAT